MHPEDGQVTIQKIQVDIERFVPQVCLVTLWTLSVLQHCLAVHIWSTIITMTVWLSLQLTDVDCCPLGKLADRAIYFAFGNFFLFFYLF